VELYCLVENRNGFERLLAMGIEEEMAAEQKRLEKESLRIFAAETKPIWETLCYYVVPKHEWGSRDCPLMPVDLS
jgi:hypothetical protein